MASKFDDMWDAMKHDYRGATFSYDLGGDDKVYSEKFNAQFKKVFEADLEDVMNDVFGTQTSNTSNKEEPLTAEKLRKMQDDFFNTRADSFRNKESRRKEYEEAAEKRRRSGWSPKHFAVAKTDYFYSWAATRLGIAQGMAKVLTHQRLYGVSSLEIAEILARNSTIPEVRNACETLINEAKGRH